MMAAVSSAVPGARGAATAPFCGSAQKRTKLATSQRNEVVRVRGSIIPGAEKDGRIILIRRDAILGWQSTRVVTPRNNFGGAVIRGVDVRQRDLETEPGDRQTNIGVVAWPFRRQWEFQYIIDMPARDRLPGSAANDILAAESEIGTKKGLAQRHKRFPSKQIAEYRVKRLGIAQNRRFIDGINEPGCCALGIIEITVRRLPKLSNLHFRKDARNDYKSTRMKLTDNLINR